MVMVIFQLHSVWRAVALKRNDNRDEIQEQTKVRTKERKIQVITHAYIHQFKFEFELEFSVFAWELCCTRKRKYLKEFN